MTGDVSESPESFFVITTAHAIHTHTQPSTSRRHLTSIPQSPLLSRAFSRHLWSPARSSLLLPPPPSHHHTMHGPARLPLVVHPRLAGLTDLLPAGCRCRRGGRPARPPRAADGSGPGWPSALGGWSGRGCGGHREMATHAASRRRRATVSIGPDLQGCGCPDPSKRWRHRLSQQARSVND